MLFDKSGVSIAESESLGRTVGGGRGVKEIFSAVKRAEERGEDKPNEGVAYIKKLADDPCPRQDGDGNPSAVQIRVGYVCQWSVSNKRSGRKR